MLFILLITFNNKTILCATRLDLIHGNMWNSFAFDANSTTFVLNKGYGIHRYISTWIHCARCTFNFNTSDWLFTEELRSFICKSDGKNNFYSCFFFLRCQNPHPCCIIRYGKSEYNFWCTCIHVLLFNISDWTPVKDKIFISWPLLCFDLFVVSCNTKANSQSTAIQNI